MQSIANGKSHGPFLTSGTDCTGPKPDGPAIGSAESVGSDDMGLVIPLLVAIKPLEVDVHVDVVVALQIMNITRILFSIANSRVIKIYLPMPDCVPFPVAEEPFPFRTCV